MKKKLFYYTMIVFFSIGLFSMMSLTPTDNTSCNRQCNALVGAGYFSSHGSCMSACNICINKAENPAQSAVCLCKTNEANGEPDTFQNCMAMIKTH